MQRLRFTGDAREVRAGASRKLTLLVNPNDLISLARFARVIYRAAFARD